MIVAKMGRPRKFQSVAELEELIEQYFAECSEKTKEVLNKKGEVEVIKAPDPLLISGLVVYLDTTRETFCDYESGKYDSEGNNFSDTIKKAKFRCQADSEQRLYTNFTPGVIFSMKNNYGWADKLEVNSTVNANVTGQINLARLSPEELEALEAMYAKASEPDPE